MESAGDFEKTSVNRINGSSRNFYAVWNEAAAILKPELTEITYQTWFDALEPIAITDDTLYFVTESELQRSTIKRLYISQVNAALKAVTGLEMEAAFLTQDEAKELLSEPEEQDSVFSSSGFVHNPKYTFDTFVIGESNRFAYTAAETTSSAIGSAYNPLLIYGGVGLGKTHLMHAIGHRVLADNPKANVLYTTSENFTNELIAALQAKENNVHYRTQFRKKYRNADVLMIDDVQFMANKESTQQEFFHTFNALKDANKQIIITSDKHPREIPGLEERLRTRFEWGLIADIQPPDMETRMAILKRKAQLEGRSIPNDVLFYIAEKIVSNIRELEGSLNRVIAYSNINKQAITLSMTERALKDIIPSKKTIVPADIKKVVCEYYGVKPEDLESKRRDTPVVIPRQVAMYLCRELTRLSLADIGVQFGGKHHTTVLHACDKVEEDMRASKEFKLTVDDFLKRLR